MSDHRQSLDIIRGILMDPSAFRSNGVLNKPVWATVTDLHKYMTTHGFVLIENMPWDDRLPESRQLLYQGPHQVVVKVKTRGYGSKGPARRANTPTMSIVVTDGKGTGWENEIFKVDANGAIVSKLLRTNTNVIVWLPANHPDRQKGMDWGVAELDAHGNVVREHGQIKIKNGIKITKFEEIQGGSHTGEPKNGRPTRPVTPPANMDNWADRGHLDLPENFNYTGSGKLQEHAQPVSPRPRPQLGSEAKVYDIMEERRKRGLPEWHGPDKPGGGSPGKPGGSTSGGDSSGGTKPGSPSVSPTSGGGTPASGKGGGAVKGSGPSRIRIAGANFGRSILSALGGLFAGWLQSAASDYLIQKEVDDLAGAIDAQVKAKKFDIAALQASRYKVYATVHIKLWWQHFIDKDYGNVVETDGPVTANLISVKIHSLAVNMSTGLQIDESQGSSGYLEYYHQYWSSAEVSLPQDAVDEWALLMADSNRINAVLQDPRLAPAMRVKWYTTLVTLQEKMRQWLIRDHVVNSR